MGRPRKTPMNQQPISPLELEVPASDLQIAQELLDSEFLMFLEQHAIATRPHYKFHSKDDEEEFQKKYNESLNRIRAHFGLTEIQLPMSNLEHVYLGKPKTKRAKKEKKVKSEEPAPEKEVDDCDHTAETCQHIRYDGISEEQLKKMHVELARANTQLNRIITLVDKVKVSTR